MPIKEKRDFCKIIKTKISKRTLKSVEPKIKKKEDKKERKA